MKNKINICLIQPPMYIHTLALVEVAIYLADLAKRWGAEVCVRKNRFARDALNIVIGAHLLPAGSEPPPGSVIFNSEQMGNQDAWFKSSHYVDLLRRYTVWDYSHANLGSIPHQNYAIIPFFHCQRLNVITRTALDRDLVFYGSINERRKKILQELDWLGPRKEILFGIYGPERDARLAGARAVLNLHYYDTQIFQQVRCFHALSNGIPVISEDYPTNSAPAEYRDCLFIVPPGTRVSEYIKRLSEDNWSSFEHEAAEKLTRFRALDALPAFTDALNMALQLAVNTAPAPLPRRLQLATGKDYRHGYINADGSALGGPDIVFDMGIKHQFPLELASENLGALCLKTDSLDEILANTAPAQVEDLVTFMHNCLCLLKPGGVLKLSVPYDLGLSAGQDPSYRRAFNQNSWLPFCEWSWQLGWLDYRFQVLNTNLTLSEPGKQLLKRGMKQADLIHTPRAVESLQVELVKRATSAEEKQLVRAYDGNFALNLDI